MGNKFLVKSISDVLVSDLKCLLFELSAVFGLQMLKLWKMFDGSDELLTAALLAVVALGAVALVDAGVIVVLPPNNDDSALALAKLNPIEELGVDDGTEASVAVTVAAVVDGDVASAVANVVAAAGATDFGVLSKPDCN